MSYDLSFTPRAGNSMTANALMEFFAGRPNYPQDRGGAMYVNEDTGVYFVFDLPDDQGVEVSFNLNYFRPHFFGLEAVIELEAFVNFFDVAVNDPQMDGMGEGAAFTREGFLRGWNKGNAFGYSAILGHEGRPEKVHAWPSAKLRSVWQWNYARRQQQESVGQEIFVPKIFPLDIKGELKSAAVWPVEQTLLPTVDAVLIPCAPDGPAAKDMAVVQWEEVWPVVKPFKTVRSGLECFDLGFITPPTEIVSFLWRRRSKAEGVKAISLDEVLDHEMVEKALLQ